MADITVPVPDDRVAEFYKFFGSWLAGPEAPPATAGTQTGTLAAWGNTAEDLAQAQVVWGKLSDRAKSMFQLLMEDPGAKLSGEAIAETLGIPNGKYGVAGVLAWPGRHSYGLGKDLPVRYEDGPVGGSANYWMEPDVAQLFQKVAAG